MFAVALLAQLRGGPHLLARAAPSPRSLGRITPTPLPRCFSPSFWDGLLPGLGAPVWLWTRCPVALLRPCMLCRTPASGFPGSCLSGSTGLSLWVEPGSASGVRAWPPPCGGSLPGWRPPAPARRTRVCSRLFCCQPFGWLMLPPGSGLCGLRKSFGAGLSWWPRLALARLALALPGEALACCCSGAPRPALFAVY